MIAFLYAIMASTSAVGCEAFFTANPGRSWLSLAWLAIPCTLITNYAIHGVLRTEGLLGLAVYMAVTSAVLRIGWTLHTHKPVSLAAWVAFGLVLLATFVKVVFG